MNKKKCTILLFEDICVDARVDRQINTLCETYDVTLCAFNSQNYNNDKVNFLSLGKPRNLAYAYLHYIFRVLNKVLFSTELLVVNNVVSIIPAFVFKLLNPKINLIYDSHELLVPDDITNELYVKKRVVFLEKLICLHANRVVCPNAERADLMKAFYGIASPFVIPNNIQDRERLEVTDYTRKFNDQKFNCIYQGVLKKGRYLEVLVASFENIENCRLFILGFGPLEKKLKALVKEKNLGNKVVFIGKAKQEELVSIAAKSDFGVVSYDFSNMNNKYCASNKLSEYVLSGIPILATPQESILNQLSTFNIGSCFTKSDLDEGNIKNISVTIELFCSKLSTYSKFVDIHKDRFIFSSKDYVDTYRFVRDS